MEILTSIAIIVMLCVGAAFTGKRFAYLHAGKVDSFFPKRKTKEQKKTAFYHSRRKVHPHDWSDPTKILQEYTELLSNKLERYARFLELRLEFDTYDDLSKDEQKAMAAKAISTTVTYNEQRGGNTVVCGDCRFLCGTSPCGCEQDYKLFKTLSPEFSNRESHYPTYNIRLDDVLYDMTH